jgi:hypothetical protein
VKWLKWILLAVVGVFVALYVWRMVDPGANQYRGPVAAAVARAPWAKTNLIQSLPGVPPSTSVRDLVLNSGLAP